MARAPRHVAFDGREAAAIGAFPLPEAAARTAEAAEAYEWQDARALADAIRDATNAGGGA